MGALAGMGALQVPAQRVGEDQEVVVHTLPGTHVQEEEVVAHSDLGVQGVPPVVGQTPQWVAGERKHLVGHGC